jgi:hypothetical protein
MQTSPFRYPRDGKNIFNTASDLGGDEEKEFCTCRYEEKREGRRKEKKTEMKHRRWSYSVNLAQRERTNGMRGGDAAKKDTKRRR